MTSISPSIYTPSYLLTEENPIQTSVSSEDFKYEPESLLKFHQAPNTGRVLTRQSSQEQAKKRETLRALLENISSYVMNLQDEKEQKECIEGVLRELESIYTDKNRIFSEKYFMGVLDVILAEQEIQEYMDSLKKIVLPQK